MAVTKTNTVTTPYQNGSGYLTTMLWAAGIIMTIIQAFWAVTWGGVTASINRIESQIELKAKQLAADKIREHERIEARINLIEAQFLRIQEHKEFTVRLDSQLSKMETRLDKTSTRDELDARLGINSNSIIQVRNEIDKLKTDLGQTYPMKEVLGNIQSRIDRMEQWSRAPPPHQQRPN